MSEDLVEKPVTIHELTEVGREKLAEVRDETRDALTAAADYIKANPWVAVAGAALLGGALVALTRSSQPNPSRDLDAVRDWLDEAYAKLPSQGEVQSMADSSGVPKFLQQLAKTLHLSS